MSFWIQNVLEINITPFMNPPLGFSSFLKSKPSAGRWGARGALPILSSSFVPKSASFSLCLPRVGYYFEDIMHLSMFFYFYCNVEDCFTYVNNSVTGVSSASAGQSSSSRGGGEVASVVLAGCCRARCGLHGAAPSVGRPASPGKVCVWRSLLVLRSPWPPTGGRRVLQTPL